MTDPRIIQLKLQEARARYSIADKIRAAICKDIIQREVGLTAIEIRATIGQEYIAPSRGKDATAKSINAFISTRWADAITRTWTFLKAIGISFTE